MMGALASSSTTAPRPSPELADGPSSDDGAARPGRDLRWWWIGAAGPEQDAGAGTDFDAVRRGCISITPIHVDLTRYQALDHVASWVGGLAAELRGGDAA